MRFEMKRHVLEIASDAKTLEEKLNNLSDRFAMETIVWANGKLFVVVREYSARPAETEQPPKYESKQRGDKHRERRLPKAGEPMRK